MPIDGTYRITTKGAGSDGADGAIVISDHNLTAGEKIRILVGQMGISLGSYAKGGSGDTFVVKGTSSLLLAARGGGGDSISSGSPYQDASITTTAKNGDLETAGGSNGNAGTNNGSSIGESGWSESSGGGFTRFAEGGFGGSGGGGYSGGGASSTETNGNVWGGGDASYNSGGSKVESVGNTGHGRVTVTLINAY